MATQTWGWLIGDEMKNHGESHADVVGTTLTDAETCAYFNDGDGYVVTGGKPFTLWTANRVYFSWQKGCKEGVASVSRNPDGKATEHIGGG